MLTEQDASDIEAILFYWFGEIKNDWPVEDRNDFWWEAGTSVDAEIKAKFGTLVERAISRDLEAWEKTARGRLATIILLDQFTRNIYRRTPAAFAQDGLARELCLMGIEAGLDQDLALVERVFFYMPLMHSEDLAEQDKALPLYQNLVNLAEGEHVDQAKQYLEGANIHRDLIVRFGRFPHRNHILARENSKAEQSYLDGDALTFGQA